MIGLLGKKVGMTRVLNPRGEFWPVTVVEICPGTVTAVRDSESSGYSAVQMGFIDIKDKHINKSDYGYLKKRNISAKKTLKEFRIDESALADYEVGKEIKADTFNEGDFVDVQAKTIGKGFQGVIKRHNMARGPETHGSMSHRRVGSIGMAATPSKTLKGQRMPGRMGHKVRTVQNLLVVKVLKEENLILVKGSLPGSDGSMVIVKKALKKSSINIEEVYTPKKVDAAKAGKKTAKR